MDRRGEHNASVRIQQNRIDDLRCTQLSFQVGDASFYEALALLGCIIFCIFGQVALRGASAIALIMAGRSLDFRRASSSLRSSAPRFVIGTELMIFD